MESESSPLHSLILLIRQPHMLVPAEDSEELKHLLAANHIRVVTNPDVSFPIAQPATRSVVVGWPFCERLWAYIFAELAMLEWDEKHSRPSSVQGFFDDITTQSARNLLAWAMLGERANMRLPWPPNLPKPPRPPGLISFTSARAMLDPAQAATFEGRVTGVFRHAVGWMILHEIAHLIGQHGPSNVGAKAAMLPWNQEQEADHFAVMWSLGSAGQRNEPDRTCVLGVVCALSTLVSAYLEPVYRLSPPGQKTHADAPTRLRRFLITFFRNDLFVWRAASILIELHLRSQDMEVPSNEKLGTDEHLCRAFEIIGGKVARA